MTPAKFPFVRDERGAVLVYVTLMLAVLVGFASLAVDLGALHLERRRLQSAADLAALAAASDVSAAEGAAAANLVQNGYDATSLVSVTRGAYAADAAVAAESRFAVSATGDAVRVAVRTEKNTIFVGALSRMTSPSNGLSGQFEISATATAVADRRAAFAIGSRLVRLDGGIANALLGALLGGSLSLDATHYEALASTRVDVFTLAERLATEANLSAVTYEQVANADVALGPAFAALLAAAREAGAGSTAIGALEALSARAASSALTVDMNQLVDFGPSGRRPLSAPPLTATVSAFDLATALAQIANSNRHVQTSLGASLPGLVQASAKVLFGQRAPGSSMVAVGDRGSTVATAQTRLELSLTIPGSGIVTAVQLPLYFEVAKGTARLSALTCTPWERTTSALTLAVRPGVIDARVGAVAPAGFADLTAAPVHSQATLVQLPGLPVVTGGVQRAWTNAGDTDVPFTYADTVAATKKTTSTTGGPASLIVADMIANMSTSVVGLDVVGVQTTTRDIVNGALPHIDAVVLGAFTALGVGLGQADTWVAGVRCGTSVLVL